MSHLTKYHLTMANGHWTLKQEGADHAPEPFVGKTKVEAVQASARQLEGTGASLRIHNLNGQFEEERTYPRSADPRSSKG